MARRKPTSQHMEVPETDYGGLVSDISVLVEQARHQAARSINGLLTATYWEVGRRIVEFEQKGRASAEYGEGLLKRLADDLAARHGRGFSRRNLRQIRGFYLGWQICRTPSGIPERRASLHNSPRLRDFGNSADTVCRIPMRRRSMYQRNSPEETP